MSRYGSRISCYIFIILFCYYHTTAQQITPLTDTTSIKIEIKSNTIYNNNTLIGSYKEDNIDSDLAFIKVYNRGHSRIAEVTHERGAGTWTVITPVDQEKMYAPYYPATPLAGLFRYLVIKGYL